MRKTCKIPDSLSREKRKIHSYILPMVIIGLFGINGLTGTSSTVYAASTNGTCGTAANKITYSSPVNNLCVTGDASTVSYSYPIYRWSCAGTGTGTSMNCSTAQGPIGGGPSGYSIGEGAKDNPDTNYTGLGTSFLSDWDNSNAFVDIMKHSRFWQDGINWHNKVGGIDEYGWPTADASTVIYSGEPTGINGTHKLIFNGQADVFTMWAPNSTVTNKKYDPISNTTTADVNFNIPIKATVGIILKNTKRTPRSTINSGFTNLRLYRPGYPTDGSVIFTTPFLDALSKVNVVRMMDWAATNTNSIQEWKDRRTPQSMKKPDMAYVGPGGYIFTGSVGASLEDQISLCNTLKSDCWINIPPAASDDYIRKMALALRYGTDGINPYTSDRTNPIYPPLNSRSKLYLEYANETWNTAPGFQSFRIINDIVSTMPVDHPLNTPVETNYWYKVWKYPAFRLVTISDTFRTVYGDAAMINQVRPVLMSQQGYQLNVSIQWLDNYAKRQSPSRDVKSYIYGAGGSGYYGPTIAKADEGNGDIYFSSGSYPANNIKGMAVDAIWAKNYGVKRIAYEGGPSLDYYTKENARKINEDIRMQNWMVMLHNAWSSIGGDLLVYYSLTGDAPWQFTPDINLGNTPKLNSLIQLQSQIRSPVTLGQKLPGSIIASESKEYKIQAGTWGGYNQTCSGLPCLGGYATGAMIAFPGNTINMFTGNITVTGVSRTPTVINIVVNGESKGQVTLAASNNIATSPSIVANIPSGLVVVRLEIIRGGIDLRSINVDATNQKEYLSSK